MIPPRTHTRSPLPPPGRVALVAVPAAAWALWASGPAWSAPALVVAATGGAVLGLVDARTHRLPDVILLPTTALTAALLALAALAGGAPGALGRAAVGAGLLAGGYLLLHLVHRSGLGLGDVKLAVLTGGLSAWHGWGVLAGATVLPFLLGGLAATVLVVSRRATGRTALAFGPYMLLGTAGALTWARVAGAS